MKCTLLPCLPILFIYTLETQDTHLNDVVSTLKERISLASYAQVGYIYGDAGEKISSTFDIKRVIFMARGEITDKWSHYFMYSLANTGKVLEVHMEYQSLPQLIAHIRQLKTMYTIENPVSPCFVEPINCYSQTVNYLVGINGSDPLYGLNGGRDMGILIRGDLLKRKLNYNLTVMSGQGINLKGKNNQRDIVGSLTVHLLDWLSVGGSFTKGKRCAIAVSSINPDIAAGDGYTRNRWSAGATTQAKPVSLCTEYLAGKDGRIKSDGYYVAASIHVLPKFGIVISYDHFNKDKAQDYKQNSYVAGVQQWFYPKCRLQAQYTYCDPHKGDSSSLL